MRTTLTKKLKHSSKTTKKSSKQHVQPKLTVTVSSNGYRTELKKQDKTMMAYMSKYGTSTTLEPLVRPLSNSKTASASASALALLSTSTGVIPTSSFIMCLLPTKAVDRQSADGSAPNEFSSGRSLSVNYLYLCHFTNQLNSFITVYFY
jgi:hypothetical protein